MIVRFARITVATLAVLALTAPLAARPAPDGTERIHDLLKLIWQSESDFDEPSKEMVMKLKEAADAKYDLLELLAKHPDAWATARAGLVVPMDAAKRDVKARILSILVHDPSPAALRTIDAQLAADATLLDRSDLLLLDERKLPRARKLLLAELEAHPDWPSNVPTAAHLAMCGVDAGKPLLVDTAKKTDLLRTMPDTWLAACAALPFLGDGAAWREARDRTVAVARDHVENGRLAHARWFLLRLEYFDRAGTERKVVSVVRLGSTVERYAEKHGAGLDSPAAITRRLDALVASSPERRGE